jgi:hypothetical protein
MKSLKSMVFIFLFFLTGCSSSEATPTERTVSFDKFFLTVPVQFVPMNPTSIDHITLKGKVLAVLKARGDSYDTSWIHRNKLNWHSKKKFIKRNSSISRCSLTRRTTCQKKEKNKNHTF